jgi:hypothetical protein
MMFGSKLPNEFFAVACGRQEAEACLGTYDTSQKIWSNTTVDNALRSWQWIV